MTQCYDTGHLRLYLESPSAMPDAERAVIAAHLATCKECRSALDGLRMLEARVMTQLSVLAPTGAPDVQAALMKMRSKLREPDSQLPKTDPITGGELLYMSSKPSSNDTRSNTMSTLIPMRQGRRRALFSTLVAAAVLFSFISFPALRAAADSLLQTFRAKSVVFVPVNADQLRRLSSLYSDPTALFITQPTIVGTPKSTTVASDKEAAQLAGFTPEQPTIFPATPVSTQFVVHDSMKVQAQVNIDTVRDLLATLGINDVMLPDALGTTPITADVPAFVETTYTGADYELTLVQGRSPSVTLPSGVDLAQLGRAGLRLIGMTPEQADQMSHQIDWSSTLVMPFPANLSDVLKVDVGDAQGLLVTSGGITNDYVAARHNLVLYWQKGDHFYVLAGHGDALTNDVVLLAARSVK